MWLMDSKILTIAGVHWAFLRLSGELIRASRFLGTVTCDADCYRYETKRKRRPTPTLLRSWRATGHRRLSITAIRVFG